jgi:hypothetical protein
MALAEDHLKQRQQVEVDPSQINFVQHIG